MIIQRIDFPSKQHKIIEREGRVFDVAFWDDEDLGFVLHNVSVSEIKERTTLLGKKVSYSDEIALTSSSNDRVAWALKKIDEQFDIEKKYFEDVEKIKRFCGAVE